MTDCKSVGLTPYEGSNPSPTTTVFPCKNGVFSRFGVPGRKHRRFGLLALCLHFLRRSGRAACNFPAVVRPCRPPVQTCPGSGRGAVPGSKRPPADRIGRPTEGSVPTSRDCLTARKGSDMVDAPRDAFVSAFEGGDASDQGIWTDFVARLNCPVKTRSESCEALLQQNPMLPCLGHGLRRWSNAGLDVGVPLGADLGFEGGVHGVSSTGQSFRPSWPGG